MPACAAKVVGLSTSLMVSVPEREMSAAALVSVRLRTSAERRRGVVLRRHVHHLREARAGVAEIVQGAVLFPDDDVEVAVAVEIGEGRRATEARRRRRRTDWRRRLPAKSGAVGVPIFSKARAPSASPTTGSRSPSPSRSAKTGAKIRGRFRRTDWRRRTADEGRRVAVPVSRNSVEWIRR